MTRLPEIQTVPGEIGDEVARIFEEDVPDYFWLARASEEHHPPDERGKGGMWLHTKRAYTAYRFLEPTYEALSLIGDYQKTCCRAAVLLHDAFKYGRETVDPDTDYHPYADGELQSLPEYTVPSHDTQMATYVREETSLPEEVAGFIESHGGSPGWYGHEGPAPRTDSEMVVHTADVFASNSEHRLPVYDPSDELCQLIDTDIPVLSDGVFDDD